MTHEGFTFGRSFFSEEFTVSGKSRTGVRISAQIARSSVVLFGLLLAWPAAADPGIGPTSSASIGISLSVAPRYGLGTGSRGHVPQVAASGGLCMATNARPATLPVMLVHAGPGQPEAIEQLPECELGASALKPVAARRSGTSLELLIVRPE